MDVPGVKRSIEACKLAQEKNLSVLSGLCYRYDEAKKETVDRIHNGAVGEIIALQGTYNTSGLWMNPRQPDWSDMEWQLRNWLYFTWLSGDHIVEQHIHTLDKLLWVMKNEPPAKATANGGRRCAPARSSATSTTTSTPSSSGRAASAPSARRAQWDNCESDVSDRVFGAEGRANLMQHCDHRRESLTRQGSPRSTGTRPNTPPCSSRSATTSRSTTASPRPRPRSWASWAAMSAYTGKTLTWDQFMGSTLDLTPPAYELGPLPTPQVAVPGQTKFK